jgi:hypothetical protein
LVVTSWFNLTHQLVSDFGRAYWMRTSLASAGGVGDQDAWLMQALDYLRGVMDAIVDEQVARSRRNRELKAWRDSRQKRTA